ncbi:MAG TPA: tannase/feruloyl esterase family alpha/beta hydrolase [Novosphingobium sp.]|nr:tannase/feruloyl esterase family alpha/beta hydrolase [Novosphingobium sp.]
MSTGARDPLSDDLGLSRLNLPRFCRVTAIASPVTGSQIGIELWLPADWNGKLLGLGNHGFGGEYERGYMAMGLQRGYAVATTDTGHSSRDTAKQAGFSAGRATFSGFNIGSAAFATGNPVAVEDFAWRAVHQMTVTAKALVTRYYGVSARRAYFDGCSTGGRQAMREVQQFPDDYDGVISGGAPMHWTRVIGSGLHYYLSGYLPDGNRIGKDKLALTQRGAVAACDGQDGLVDGLIADPRRCRFDAFSLVCKPGQDPKTCLNSAEARAVARVERPFADPRDGAPLYSPLPPGGESHWRLMTDLNPVTAAHFRYLVMNDTLWTPTATTDLWEAITRSELPGAPGLAINSVSRDLSAFRNRGGKLIQYHGWSDEAMSANFYPKYYGEVVDLQPGRNKLAQTQAFYRLFMVPGMTHCNGGDGPVNFGGLNHIPSTQRDPRHDILEALDRWVERGKEPSSLIASEFGADGAVKRQMPLCPWPQVARYVGGDSARAESFTCRAPDSADSGAGHGAARERLK